MTDASSEMAILDLNEGPCVKIAKLSNFRPQKGGGPLDRPKKCILKTLFGHKVIVIFRPMFLRIYRWIGRVALLSLGRNPGYKTRYKVHPVAGSIAGTPSAPNRYKVHGLGGPIARSRWQAPLQHRPDIRCMPSAALGFKP